MNIAWDSLGFRTHISDAKAGHSYYCMACMWPLVVKNGQTRQAHFAHKKGSDCCDSWQGVYDMSDWHSDWQNRFPKENQEVLVQSGSVKHRADILTGHTVIEFQHSPLSVSDFNNRNNFYCNLGYKVVWLFDLSEDYGKGNMVSNSVDDSKYYWNNPRRTFNNYDLSIGQIELFFQIKEEGEQAILKVKNSCGNGYNEFVVSRKMTIEEFVTYFNNGNSICEEPARDYLAIDEEYLTFKEKYNVKLNPQQDRCVQTIEGSNLVLAVPGSGKTTVLISRIGYMVKCKHVKPERILSLTYTKAAASEMKERYEKKFGQAEGVVDFRTLNSLTYKIVREYGDYGLKMIDEGEDKRIIIGIYKEIMEEGLPTDSEITQALTSISYIKNMMLSEEEAANILVWDNPAYDILKMYQNKLREQGKMDFDDTLIFTLDILNTNKKALDFYQSMYDYCLVDEAQDTSKIQFEIIKKLVGKHNKVFMVGDEDQSIYRFRAAYPEELLHFEEIYPNPFRMEMTENYRSNEEIIEQTNRFISRNTKRYPKEAHSYIGKGGCIEKVIVTDREAQFEAVLSMVKESKEELAILCRNNDSAIPVIDGMIEMGLPFKTNKKNDFNLFSSRTTTDVMAFIRLACNNKDYNAFKTIYGKCGLYIKKKDAEGAIEIARNNDRSVLDQFVDYMHYGTRTDGEKADKFKKFIEYIAKITPREAISYIYEFGYSKWLEDRKLGEGSKEILRILARKDKNLSEFVNHMENLKIAIAEHENVPTNITISTIHSSKGLEYDSVCVADVIEGVFPIIDEQVDEKEQEEQLEEERRIFYVAMTRARKKLTLFKIQSEASRFCEEIEHTFTRTFVMEEKKEVHTVVGHEIEELVDKVIYSRSTKTLYPCFKEGKVINCENNACPCDSCEYRGDTTVFVNDSFYDNGMVRACKYRFKEIYNEVTNTNCEIVEINRLQNGQVHNIKIENDEKDKSILINGLISVGSTVPAIIRQNPHAEVIYIRNITSGWKFAIYNNDLRYYRTRDIFPFYKGALVKGKKPYKVLEIYSADQPVWVLEWKAEGNWIKV